MILNVSPHDERDKGKVVMMRTWGVVCGGWGLHRWRQDVCVVLLPVGMAVIGVRSKEKEKPLFKTPTSTNNHVTPFQQSRPQHFSECSKPKQAEAMVNARSAAPPTATMKRVAKCVTVNAAEGSNCSLSRERRWRGGCATEGAEGRGEGGQEGKSEVWVGDFCGKAERFLAWALRKRGQRRQITNHDTNDPTHKLLFYQGRRGVYTSLSVRLHSSMFIFFISRWQPRPKIWFQADLFLFS